MREFARELVEHCSARSLTLATCESITGGGIGAAITDVPGASVVFRGGLITYATDLKTALAHVGAGLIQEQGVVSEDVAARMASGARDACGADWAVATTGVAGPGASDGVPAGTVCFAVAGPTDEQDSSSVRTARRRLHGERAAVRQQAVDFALSMLLRRIEETTASTTRE